MSDWHTVKHKTMLKTKEKQCFSKREEIPHLWVTLTHKTAICCWDDNEAPHSSTQPTDVPLPFLQVLHSNPTLKAECKGPWMVPTEQEDPQLSTSDFTGRSTIVVYTGITTETKDAWATWRKEQPSTNNAGTMDGPKCIKLDLCSHLSVYKN